MIQRLDVVTDRRVLVPSDNGVLVRYSDHEAALAAERAKVRELVEALKVAASDQMRLSCVYSFRDDDESERATDKRYDASIALIEKYSKEEPNES